MMILNLIFFCNFLEVIHPQKTDSDPPTCENPQTGELSWGIRIKETYLQFENLSLIQCVRQCLRRNRCSSLNYSKVLNFCELNYMYRKDGTRYSEKDSDLFVHSDISGWSKALIGICKDVICAVNEKCNGSGLCETSDCGPAPNPPQNAVVLHTRHYEVGNGFYYGCKEGFKIRGIANAKIQRDVVPVECMQNGQWETLQVSCEEVLMFDGHWYYFSTKQMTWQEARNFCLTMNSHLVKVDSEAEKNWILKTIKEKGMHAWTGANDIVHEGKWVWEVDNSDVTWQNWYGGVQAPTSPRVDCILLNHERFIYLQCDQARKFICEQ